MPADAGHDAADCLHPELVEGRRILDFRPEGQQPLQTLLRRQGAGVGDSIGGSRQQIRHRHRLAHTGRQSADSQVEGAGDTLENVSEQQPVVPLIHHRRYQAILKARL